MLEKKPRVVSDPEYEIHRMGYVDMIRTSGTNSTIWMGIKILFDLDFSISILSIHHVSR
jgi:hypothetical protein